jgi:hypothetical protein
MLAPDEFMVGSMANTAPLSLILPRTERECALLIGRIEQTSIGVILSGQHAFMGIEEEYAQNWQGLIVPNVRIEVDETSLFDPGYNGGAVGSIIRTDTRLVIRAKRERHMGNATFVTLHDKLAPTGEQTVGFHRWQVVIGGVHEKRVLWQTQDDVR